MEAWQGFTLWIPPRTAGPVQMEVSAFKVPPADLDGHPGLRYQFGLSDRSSTRDIQEMRAGQPELPASGDRRSGVLVLDGDHQVVAGYIIDGRLRYQNYRISVHPDYRGRRISGAMILEWYKRTQRPRVVCPQKLNPLGVRAFLSGQNAVYAWAEEQGRAVPDKVLCEAETNHILEVLARVEKTGQQEVLGG